MSEPTRTTIPIPDDPDRVRELRDGLPVDRMEIRHLLDDADEAFAALATAGRSWAVAA